MHCGRARARASGERERRDEERSARIVSEVKQKVNDGLQCQARVSKQREAKLIEVK